jgi:hypothetical protein
MDVLPPLIRILEQVQIASMSSLLGLTLPEVCKKYPIISSFHISTSQDTLQ